MLFGMTGEKHNMSVLHNIDPNVDSWQAGLSEDGQYLFSDYKAYRDGYSQFIQSIGWEDAVALQNTEGYSKDCGVIAVGFSYLHMKKIHADPDVRQVIGYHTSDMPVEVKPMTHLDKSTDYTPVQNTLNFGGFAVPQYDIPDGVPSYATPPQDVMVGRKGPKTKKSSVQFDIKARFAELSAGKTGAARTAAAKQTLRELLQLAEENGLVLKTTKAKAGHGDFNLYEDLEKTGDPYVTTDHYIEYCIENGWLPMFYEFALDQNYYKDNFDFNVFDRLSYNPETGLHEDTPDRKAYAPQTAVHMLNEDGSLSFPEDFFEIVDKQMQGYDQYQQYVAQKMPDIMRDIRSIKDDSGKPMISKESARDAEATGQYADSAKFSERVTDKKTLAFLNGQETITTYKTMQLVDGKLYPPMAARTEGKYEDYSILGEWEQATEHPELITDGNQYKLDKGKGQGSLKAAYNPYMHSSNLVLNDQFSGAYSRPQLVTVECEVPVSELTSGYHAQYAKDSVGWHAWHTGTVAGQLRKARGIERQVFLSRWIKPVRIVPDSEVAGMYKDLLDGTDIAVPDNVVTPSLLNELKKAGVKTKESGKVKYSVREAFYKEYDAWDKKSTHVSFVTGTTSDALKSIGMRDQNIVLRSGTVLQKIKDHPEMTFDIFKGIPELLEHPVIVQFSDAIDPKTKRPKYKSSITVLGELYADVVEDGKTIKKPVLVSLELLPTKNKGTTVLDFAIIKSAYSKNALQQYLNENSILYIDPDKKRTDSWLSLTRLQLPFGENRYGPIRRIAYDGDKVKVENPKNMTAMERAMRKAGVVDSFGRKNSDRDTAPTFYSHMARVVDGVKQEKLGAASVVSMLRGKGVKAEEIKWSGIEAWLEGKKSVTKAELQEFIAGSMLQIEEETLHDDDDPYTEEEQAQISKFEEERETIAEQLKAEWKRIVGTDIPIRNFGAGLEHSVVEKLMEANTAAKANTEAGYKYRAAKAALQRVIEDDDWGYDTDRQAFREAVRNPKSFMDNFEMTSFQKGVFRDFIKAKEAYSKVPGIPMDDQKALIAIAASADRFSSRIAKVQSEHRAKEAKRRTKWGQYKLSGGTNYRELLFRMPDSDYSNDAMYTHWENRYGVLAHARIQDLRIDGKWALFVEELQSDWHNSGHKDGYRKRGAEDKQALSWKMEQYTEEFFASEIAGVIEDKISAIGYEGAGVSMILNYLLDSNTTESTLGMLRRKGVTFTESEVNKLMEYVHSYEDLYHQWENAPSEVTAPEAPFSANYHEFVMKRLIRMAAEGGYDSIGWTTKDIQMDRWNPGRKTNAQMGVKAKDPDAVAFERAYTIEYDQGIPKFMGDYGKKWGAKVERSEYKGNPVWTMTIPDAMKQSVLYEGQALYSDRDIDSVSNRDILANAFMDVAQNDIERGKIAEYQEKIKALDEDERKLRDIRAQLHDLSFSAGPRDNAKIRELREKATKLANRIGIQDKQLLRLEASKPLMAVLEREKKLAYSRASQKWEDRIETARTGRNKTEMRHKVKKIVGELNNLLLHGTKDKHIMIGLQKATAEALSAINMDTVAAEERLAKIQAKIDKATDPAEKARLQQSYARVEAMGDNMATRLTALKNAYEEIKDSGDPLVANAYQPEIEERIKNLRKMVGDTPLRNMSMEQLEFTYDTYKMVLTTIRNANKAFKNERGESIAVLGNRSMEEIERVGGKKELVASAMRGPLGFAWSGMKPTYAFKAIGSDTLSEVFSQVRAGEDVWAKDANEAKEFYSQKTKQYNYDSWDLEKEYTFTSKSGKEFKLTLEQIMSLYAYSKRKQADAHLDRGGFVFDSSIEVVKRSKLGIPVKYRVNTAHAHALSRDTLMEICKTLTDEQVKFVDEMQDYLSTVMGEKGNEVSLKMYGVKLFKEKFYFPLKSAKQFMYEQYEVAGDRKIKNSGFSKDTTPHASNPVILNNFTDVWATHVNDMAMYHAFVLPMEDFERVFNYKTPTSDTMPTESVKGYLQDAYGVHPEQYIKQLMTDLNGGARIDPTAGIINKGIALFKKSAVFASLSVVIQQPSAIARAMAYIDAKYFVGKPGLKDWDEVKKYAPVAIIKEMGYFDTNMGKSTVDFIKAKEYEGAKAKMKALVTDSQFRDDILSKAPSVADELAWCQIWNAVKKEIAETKKLQGEELLQAAGKRFTEVIVNTQVYDSVLTRSGMMRSKDTGMKMATSFMAEPTTSLNMIADALIQGKRGNKGYARKTIGAVAASMILNSILVSFVYAGRDDDEDKTYAEKYAGRLTSELIDSFNPLTLIPFVKDIVSIAQGYDVERSDMAVITDLFNAWKKLSNDNLSVYRKVEDFGGAIASIFGLPLKNIMRDVRGIYNTVKSAVAGPATTGRGMLDAAKESLPKWMGGGERSNADQLYAAMLSGDTGHVERLKARFKDDRAFTYAVRDGLVNNDKRITAAAKARAAGNQTEYMRLARDIVNEGHFSQDDVVRAVNYVLNSLTKKESEPAEATKPDTFKIDEYLDEALSGDQAEAELVKREIIAGHVADGKTEEEALKSFNNSFKNTAVKGAFTDGDITMDVAIAMLQQYGGVEPADAYADVQYWQFKQNHPDIYVVDSWFDSYYEYASDAGIGIDVYMQYRNDVKNITGEDKKARRMAAINALPLSAAQKDALYFDEGWVASKLHEAPWR